MAPAMAAVPRAAGATNPRRPAHRPQKRARPGQAKAGAARLEKTALAIRAEWATARAQRSRPKAREASQNASAFSVQSRAEGATENTPRAPCRNRRLWRPSALESRLRQVRDFIGAADPDHAARKVTVPRGDRVAIIFEGDDPNTDAKVTYRELHRRVCQLANAMRGMGGLCARVIAGGTLAIGDAVEWVDA